MRRKIVAGNWKMNLRIDEGIALVGQVMEHIESMDIHPEVVFGSSFIHLESVSSMVKDFEGVHAAAQDCSSHRSGAFTGEVSAQLINSVDASMVIIGHSERRTYHNEAGELLKEKIERAIEENLEIIFCFGEELKDRYEKRHFTVVESQLRDSLTSLPSDARSKIILAYEPVWAIGTGETATAEQAQEMHAFIRDLLSKMWDVDTAEKTSILYGGSCKPSNARELFSCPDIDGGLIGGASLKADDFIQLISIGQDELH
jgi:triosephosphate isomerase